MNSIVYISAFKKITGTRTILMLSFQKTFYRNASTKPGFGRPEHGASYSILEETFRGVPSLKGNVELAEEGEPLLSNEKNGCYYPQKILMGPTTLQPRTLDKSLTNSHR